MVLVHSHTFTFNSELVVATEHHGWLSSSRCVHLGLAVEVGGEAGADEAACGLGLRHVGHRHLDAAAPRCLRHLSEFRLATHWNVLEFLRA